MDLEDKREDEGRRRNEDGAVFTINGNVYKVGGDVPVYTSLNSYIRDCAVLPGTKYMCKEGSCGSCVVNLKYTDPATKNNVSVAVNSCLMPVLACHGTAVTTIEGIGSRKAGYNKVQTTLAHFNGTQCGFCSPGFVMTMYSLLDVNPKVTVDEVENQFSGNLCRCTGYRPILDAFKSLASNPPIKLKQRLLEIEEAHILCPNRGKCGDKEINCASCLKENDPDSFELDFSELALANNSFKIIDSDGEWYRACCLKEIFQIFDRIGAKRYILLAGNTARGVKKPAREPQVYIDVNSVPDLKGSTLTTSSLTVGSGTHLNEFKDILINAAAKKPASFSYADQMAKHITLVASVPIRNRATVGGNLGLVNGDKTFPSDIFLLLDAVSATITIASLSGITRTIPAAEFRSQDLNKKVITKVTLPACTKTSILKSYKIMPVNQSAVAIVNGAFLYNVDKTGKLNSKPNLVLSGINPTFRHAFKTENYLSGKNIFRDDVLKVAVETLWKEVIPDNEPTSFSPHYRKLLATALLYRSILSLAGDKVSAKNRSGAEELVRPISSGKQVYQSDEKEYPLTQPIPKLEAQIQTAGEATYVNDYEKLRTELVGHLVLARKFADISKIDPSKALKMKGVVAFYSEKDIPGENLLEYLFPQKSAWGSELFSSGSTRFWGQPVGMIVAETEDIAERAAEQVIISYKPPKKPLLNVRDVLASGERDKRVKLNLNQKAKTTESGKITFEGELDISMSGQYAHAMETPSCRVIPEEDDQYRTYVSTQSILTTRKSIAQVIGLPLNKIDCIVPRVGGSYGSKNTSQLYGVCGCAVAASKLQRPVRMTMSLPNEMDSIGKRFTFYVKYKGQADEKGKIQSINLDVYVDSGYSTISPVYMQVLLTIQNYYDTSSWNINIYAVSTDKPPMVILRGPGFMESVSAIEQIIDHVALAAKMNPVDVRIANSGDTIINDYIRSWAKDTDYENRLKKIDQFNEENRWIKRGIALTASKYPMFYQDSRFGCKVDILYPDGTIQIQHGGIEMGQGIHTKVAQAVAFELNRPLSSIQIKQSNSFNAPNDTPSLGSVSSELVVHTAIQCCKQLNAELAPIKASLKNPTWADIVTKAFNDRSPLTASLPIAPFPSDKGQMYFVYGVCVSEIELDILTGKHQILRVDILEDVGMGLSPEIDVGQVEGGFIMALGLHTTERLIFDKNTGALLTDRLWFYHVPRSKDIPIDLRVTFVPNATNPVGVLNSKATGEPSTALAISVVNSFRYGIRSARKDAGQADTWINLGSPCTPETILLASYTTPQQFTL